MTANTLTSRFFSWLTEDGPDVGLATLENGSIWYSYAGRPVEVLGWTTRSIAEGPRNPNPVLGAIDSRLDLGVWERERPEIVWLDTQVSEESQFDPSSVVRRSYSDEAHALLAFVSSTRHWWWTQPYFGSRFLLDAYDARLTIVNETHRILWFVRSDRARVFDRRLEAAGFVLQQ